MDVVSLIFWEEGERPDEEVNRFERRVEALLGGVKMSLPSASLSIPKMVAALWAADGFMKQSLPRT